VSPWEERLFPRVLARGLLPCRYAALLCCLR
jgi:hypothetical protein